jgi:hypothetical protein
LRWRQNAVQKYVVFLSRNEWAQLFIECDSTSDACNLGQEAVKKTPAPPQPVSSRVKD